MPEPQRRSNVTKTATAEVAPPDVPVTAEPPRPAPAAGVQLPPERRVVRLIPMEMLPAEIRAIVGRPVVLTVTGPVTPDGVLISDVRVER